MDATLSDCSGLTEPHVPFVIYEDTEAERVENLFIHQTRTLGISENGNITDEVENFPKDHSAQTMDILKVQNSTTYETSVAQGYEDSYNP